LGECFEAGPLGEVLADESVGVLVGAAFPSMMWQSEVDSGVESLLEELVHVELGAVVGGDGMDGMRLVPEQGSGAGERLLGADPGDLAEAEETAAAFDKGHGGWFAFAMQGVGFPVAEATALVDEGRALSDHAFAGEAPPAVLAGIALAAPFVGASEMLPERATAGFVLPDVQVDRFHAHDAQSFGPQPADDLLGAEFVPQHALDRCEVLCGVAPVAARAAAPTVGLLYREHRTIVAIVDAAVALHLTIDGAAVPTEGSRDLVDRVSLASHRCDGVSFLRT